MARRSGARRHATGYRRTAITGGASLALVALGVAVGSGPAGAEFSNGVAKATAVTSRVAPGVGSLALGITGGVAVSEVRNSLAQAQAQATDLGLIGSTLTAEGCDGDDAYVTPDQLPGPTRVDNREGDASATDDEFPIAGATAGGGREEARATKDPASAGATATSAASFGPVANLSGGRAEAITEIVDGSARQARASVEGTLEIAGVVKMAGMRWSAVHRTGSDPRADGGFEPGETTIGGVPAPPGDPAVLEGAINTALAPMGITVTFPKVERLTEPTDLVRVTPLRIVLADSPAGKAALGPGLNLTREQRSELFELIASRYCRAAGALLVGDIALSIASGTGFLAIEIGGVEAQTADLVLEDPFGSFTAAPSDVLPVSGLPGTPGTPAVPGAPAPVAGAVPAAAPAAAQPVADVGPLESLCETIHPRGGGCSEGAMLPLGAMGLAATLGVGALDWQHQRRRAATQAILGQAAP
jgi:hypothetical protein